MGKQFSTAGARAIHPTVATSSSVASCSIHAQLLWSRLLAAADDQGRQLGDPLLVRAACLPLVEAATPRKIEQWLSEIEAAGMIRRYEANGQRLIQISKWWDYQAGMRHAWPSRWPAPQGWAADTVRGHGAAGRDPAGTPPGPVGPPSGQHAEPNRTEPNHMPNRTRTGGYDDVIQEG